MFSSSTLSVIERYRPFTDNNYFSLHSKRLINSTHADCGFLA
jgi:hypothetical protein